jgi:hypothetical protein
VFNNCAHCVELGEMFQVDRVMYEVVHTSGGNEAMVHRMDNCMFSTMNVVGIIGHLNEISLS